MALSQKLGLLGGPGGQALGTTAAGELSSRARTFGQDPTGAIAGMRGQISNAGASNAFGNAMSVAGSRANEKLGLANSIVPNYNTANAFNAIGDIADTYSLYKGYRG
jgi:hypothetical protein